MWLNVYELNSLQFLYLEDNRVFSHNTDVILDLHKLLLKYFPNKDFVMLTLHLGGWFVLFEMAKEINVENIQ